MPQTPKTSQAVNGPSPDGATHYQEESGYGPFHIEQSYPEKHMPEVGGYYVVHKDGYKSFSPANAFEEGYTRI